MDDSWNYKGVVVDKGFTSNIPVLEWFIADADYNEITSRPTDDITGSAVLAYNGQVFDNIRSGSAERARRPLPKTSWKIEMPRDHNILLPGLVEAVDEFAMQSDFSDGSHGRPPARMGFVLQGGCRPHPGVPGADPTQRDVPGSLHLRRPVRRHVARPRRLQRRPVLQGRARCIRRDKGSLRVPVREEGTCRRDFSGIAAFLDGVDLTGAAQANFLRANADIPQLINYAVATAVVQHVDSLAKNFYLSQDDLTGRWKSIPWDLDHTFGNGCCQVNSPFVTPAEPADRTSELMRAILAAPEWRAMYFRRLRTVVNQVLAAGQLEALYDAKVGPAQPESTLDLARWPRNGSPTYASLRNSLFSSIQARRNAFANDARVPGNQPATPNIVINEIQPAVGRQQRGLRGAVQPVDDYRDRPVRLVDHRRDHLAIQPGAVILPGATMTFVANDPAFRATYGVTPFVGGIYTGDLPASATLTLTRPDASIADTLTYGGAGWPDPSTGRSLELTNPALDNGLRRQLGAVDPARRITQRSQRRRSGRQRSRRADHRQRHRRQHVGDGPLDAPGNAGGSAIAGYKVQVLDAAGAQVGALRAASPSATSMVVTGLAKGVAVHFVVTAINNAGAGPASASSNTVTPPATTVPGFPVIGNATAGTAGGAATATARWTPPTSTGGSQPSRPTSSPHSG